MEQLVASNMPEVAEPVESEPTHEQPDTERANAVACDLGAIACLGCPLRAMCEQRESIVAVDTEAEPAPVQSILEQLDDDNVQVVTAVSRPTEAPVAVEKPKPLAKEPVPTPSEMVIEKPPSSNSFSAAPREPSEKPTSAASEKRVEKRPVSVSQATDTVEPLPAVTNREEPASVKTPQSDSSIELIPQEINADTSATVSESIVEQVSTKPAPVGRNVQEIIALPIESPVARAEESVDTTTRTNSAPIIEPVARTVELPVQEPRLDVPLHIDEVSKSLPADAEVYAPELPSIPVELDEPTPPIQPSVIDVSPVLVTTESFALEETEAEVDVGEIVHAEPERYVAPLGLSVEELEEEMVLSLEDTYTDISPEVTTDHIEVEITPETIEEHTLDLPEPLAAPLEADELVDFDGEKVEESAQEPAIDQLEFDETIESVCIEAGENDVPITSEVLLRVEIDELLPLIDQDEVQSEEASVEEIALTDNSSAHTVETIGEPEHDHTRATPGTVLRDIARRLMGQIAFIMAA